MIKFNKMIKFTYTHKFGEFKNFEVIADSSNTANHMLARWIECFPTNREVLPVEFTVESKYINVAVDTTYLNNIDVMVVE